MSDTADADPNQTTHGFPAGAGTLLRQAREATGLHIAALAVMLKVPVKKLEALEGNRFDLLPDAVFVRALASSVCRTLKIDAVPVLAQLPTIASPKLTYRGAGINEEFRAPGYAPGPSKWTQLSKPAVLAGIAFLLGALVLVFLPAIKAGIADLKSTVEDSKLMGLAGSEGQKPSDAAVPAKPLFDDSPAKSASTQGALAAASASKSVAASSPTLIFDTKIAIPVVAPAPASATFVANSGSALPSDVVVLTASGESWVEATDAKGKVVFRRMLAAGEVAGVGGLLPLRVTVGRANVTQVQIRGKGFDLSPVSKDNVARFEVK